MALAFHTPWAISRSRAPVRKAWTVLALVFFLLPALGAPPADGPSSAPACWPPAPGADPRDCPPDDPGYPGRWEFRGDIPESIDRSKMHPAELALGSIGFSLDRAWQQTIGHDDTVIAVLDSGIRWNEPDLRNKLWLNRGELPLPARSSAYDANGDGVFDVRDYIGDQRVLDVNADGFVDAGDLIAAFSDCRDDDGNGYPDDISGYDFFDGEHCGSLLGDSDPGDDTNFGHGTGIAETAAGETNNGYGGSGVCPRCRILPVRVGDSFVVDANRFARGLIFAARSGVDAVAAAVGSYNNTPTARRAVDLAYELGVPLIASAADEFSYHHNYPSVYNHALYVNSIRDNHRNSYEKSSTFWGVNPCTNYGARVWVTVPARSCSSGATSRLGGIVGLMQSMAREAHGAPLHAEEIYQVLRATADDLDNREPDWGKMRWVARPGFDQYYGYGRVNAGAAVSAVREGEIPPQVDLLSPRWFAVVSPSRSPTMAIEGRIRLERSAGASFRLDYALGVEPAESDYHRVVDGGVERGTTEGLLGVLDFRELPRPTGAPPLDREDRDRFSVTLRLSVTDRQGRTAEARRSFFVFDDPTWKQHFPVDLDVSGEAAPLLVDLDDDGRDEIVLGTADGRLTIFRWRPSGLERSILPLGYGPPLAPQVDGQSTPRPGETVIRGPVSGVLGPAGSGLSLVVATREGRVYAFDARGERRSGFPVSIDRDYGRAATEQRQTEVGILSRPVLADLDGVPGSEIVVSALDGRLYVWRGDGRPLPGFPVAVGQGDERHKLVSSPAVGDLDGDGTPEIVVGSNRIVEGRGAAYAIRARGTLDPDGPFVPGFAPFEMNAVRPDLLPTLAHGVHATAELVDIDADGDQEVLIFAVTGDAIHLIDVPQGQPARAIARYGMRPDAAAAIEGLTYLGGTGSPLVADTDHDGSPELYASLLPMRMLTLRTHPGIPLDVPLALGGWEIGPSSDRVGMLPGWPPRMEDLMIFSRPAATDVDGDGVDEVLMSSGGYLLHAFDRAGKEAPRFPKFTGGWIFSQPAVGDLDGDGRAEIVSVTREGFLFAWETGAPAAPAR